MNMTESLYTDFSVVDNFLTVRQAIELVNSNSHRLIVMLEGKHPVGVCSSELLSSKMDDLDALVMFSKPFAVLNQGQVLTRNLLIYDYLLMTNDDGDVVGWLDSLTAENLYLKHHCSEDIRELALDLEAIVDSVYDEILVVDPSGTILRVSMRSGHNLWGIAPVKIVGMNILDLEEKGWFKPTVTRRVLDEQKKVSMIQESRLNRTILAVANPIFNRDGSLERIVIASRDITEISQLQSELAHVKKQREEYKREINSLRRSYEIAEKSIIYKSDQMDELMQQVKRVSNVESTVAVYGESGVGKELIVHAIHHFSPRSDKPFMKINCSSIPENLLESELFGYERGAFTGALGKGKKGLLELAHTGTLFLDEIADLPLNLQVKLLRAIQEKEIMKVGGDNVIKVNVRIVTATNRDLEKMVDEGEFREDLYYRLHVIPLYVPALRERPEDIELLAYNYLQHFNKKFELTKHLSEDAIEVLNAYHWPGNIRQLQNVIERASVITQHQLITANDLKPLLKQRRAAPSPIQVNSIIPLQEAVRRTEHQLIQMALSKYKTITRAAEVLQTSQPTISRRLKNRINH